MFIPREGAARQLPTHRAVPSIADDQTANRHRDEVGGRERSAPPQHPRYPDDDEDSGAAFQSGRRVHGSSPMAEKTSAIIRVAGSFDREVDHVKPASRDSVEPQPREHFGLLGLGLAD